MDTKLAENSFRFSNEEKWFEIVMKVDKFPSVNNLYETNRYGARFMRPEVSHMKWMIKEQIIKSDPKKYCDWISPDIPYKVTYNFILKSSLWKRDTDNMIKVMQDGIFESLNVNDARIVEIHGYKSYRNSDHEYLIIRLGRSSYNVFQFNN